MTRHTTPSSWVSTAATGWDCERGYTEADGSCVRVAVPANGYLRDDGGDWECERGFRKAAESRARESYWTALFRARRQGSLTGVLAAAEAFGALGDRVMVEQCIRIAERLAQLTADAEAADRVRTLAAGLVQRCVETEVSGALPGR